MDDDAPLRAVAVIVHWGEPSRTMAVISALRRQNPFDRLVVVANDGCPAPTDAGSEAGNHLDWIVAPRNLGFGAACQLGASTHKAHKYAFLNNDVVISPQAASACLDALDAPGVGLAGPVLLRGNGTLQSGCGTFSRWLQAPRVDRWPAHPHETCPWVTGAALFARHDIVTELGFDGSYFLGMEDSDLCERAAADGWSTVCVATAVGEHDGGATISGPRWQYYAIRNRIWFCRRRRTWRISLAVLLWMALVMLPRVAVADLMKRRTPARSRLVLWAVIHGCGPLPPFGSPRPDEPVPQRWLTW